MRTILQKQSIWFLGLFVLAISSGNAQKSIQSVQKLQDEQRVSSYTVSEERGTPSFMTFDSNVTARAQEADAPTLIREALNLDNKTTIAPLQSTGLKNGLQVKRYQEYYKGVKVEHGSYRVISKNGGIQAIGLEHYELSKDMTITPSLSEDAAMQKAINFVGATEYAWDMYSTMKMNETNPQRLAQLDEAIESVYPKGELVIVDDYSTAKVDMKLAYKFNVYAAEPLYRADIYIDAQDGKMLLADMDIKHAADINKSMAEGRKMSTFAMVSVEASGDLRYAGRRNFQTTMIEGTDPVTDPDRFVLLGTIMVDAVDPIDGQIKTLPIENETKSYDGVGGVPLSVGGFLQSYDITDGSSRPEEGQTTVETADNDWTADEHRRDRFEGANTYPETNETNNDDTGVDAHWGSEIVLRYWGERHDRYSWDGQGRRITSFVHYGDAYDNAFYTNGTMTYGDGSYQGGTNPNGSFAPLMSLDVAGHEIGHGVCDTTSGLVYARQSGGMNEGFSDLWAAAVENFAIESFDTDGTFAQRFQPYGIGEQIDERDGGIQPEDSTPESPSGALRYMDDPKANGDPDCILGANWQDTTEEGCPAPNTANDQCGVHTNSGVLNKWFYLLVEGSGKDFKPGLGKEAADDEMNDNGQEYSVEGIGFEKAEFIAFGGEVVLGANATYADMRMASEQVAIQLYGEGSPEHEATINAWFGVCVGEAFVRPEGNVVRFNADNATTLQERNSSVGCDTSRIYTYNISSTLVDTPTAITLDASNSTATINEDFTLSRTEIMVSGSGVYSFDVELIDDAIIEEGEMINITFDFNDTTQNLDIALVDDDITPKVGASVEELMPMQEFEAGGLPEGWAINTLLDPSVNNWFFDGTGAPGLAYITGGTVAVSESPQYDGNGMGAAMDGNSNTILMTPLINGLGLRDITVEFDYQAGGEVEGATALDYGELVYSFDGTNFFNVERFFQGKTGDEDGIGTYNDVLNQVDNSQFYIGFRWFNDQLAAGAFSFTVDNVIISGSPALVETTEGATQSHVVRQDNDIFFQSVEGNNIMARIENASADLGCVSLNITQAGTDAVENTDAGFTRASKVIQIDADGPDAATATYDVTFYLTTEELADFGDLSALSVLKVEGNDIDASTPQNSVINGGLIDDLTGTEGYATFRGSFTGFSSFTVVQEAVAGTDDFNTSDITIFPSPVTRGEDININSGDFSIESATVFDVRGSQVLSQDFDGQSNVKISSSGLQTGFYFVRLNNDASKTFKFIVR